MRWQPSIRVVPPYFEEMAYIDALAISTREELAKLDLSRSRGSPPSMACPGIMSRRAIRIIATVRKTTPVREALDWREDRLILTFQSRFGSAEWLPYTASVIEDLARSGVKRVAVIRPDFPPTASRRWKRWASTGRPNFSGKWRRAFRSAAVPERRARKHPSAFQHRKARQLGGWAEFREADASGGSQRLRLLTL